MDIDTKKITVDIMQAAQDQNYSGFKESFNQLLDNKFINKLSDLKQTMFNKD